MDTHYSFNFDDKYLRNAAFSFISSTMYGEMNWYTAKQPYGSVGGIGLTLQRLILEKYGIPTCILNGAEGGAAIGLLTERDPIYHANPNTFYGRLLHRAQWANVVQQVKAIIFKQGEADAGASMTTGGQYSETLTRLFSQFREDFGDARIYVGQINILPDRNEEAAAIREVQRQVRYNFKNIESVATIGTPLGEDGVHYSAEANQQLALEQFRLIARDFYGSKDTVQIGSPDIKKVFYNTQKDSITLVFDGQMQMVWKNDTAFYSFSDGSLIVRRELKDYFFLDGLAGQITGGAAKGNRIIISLKQPAAAKKLRYMPTYFSDNLPTYYYGQTLRNTRGMRAFSFDNFPIADAIPAVTTLVARPVSGNQIQLNWNAPATATTQILERADGNHTSFKRIKTLNHYTETYTDTLANSIDTYFYRIRTFSAVSESDYSNVVSARALVLGLKPTGSSVRLYPIPLLAGQNLHIEADEGELTDVVIRDMMGRVVKSWSGSKRNGIAIPVDNVATGLYVADLQMADGQVVHQKIVIH
ncbi:hypothetical protein GCM10023189_05880 [Nibrella saemangeumensis]|uniref:Fibronectin type-III domain-containing protein n=2 Tax=Nibrella saemangeumensis TaxID=1084526 RepID=A0ABP8MC76_9BACT